MFEVGFSEMMIILIIALVVIGPERLPEVARGLGRMVGKVRQFIDNVRNESSLQTEIAELRRQLDMSKEVNEIKDIGQTLQNSLNVAAIDVNASIYDRPSTESIREQHRSQQDADVPSSSTPDHDAEPDLSQLQRPTFGREQYEELPPYYHQQSDGALASKAPAIPEMPQATVEPVAATLSSGQAAT